ncbi:MAG: DUF1801 domain-containing protein [Bacteriovoracaceae bacterium]|nr:DUF1801 domain-containing protein [Bacteriovoracaceae bacterium]
MKTYENFGQWKKDQTKSTQVLIQALRKLVNSSGLPLTETVKWGNGCWVKKDLPILYIHSLDDGAQFGFFAGSKISDPKGLLEGKGKFVRFITVRSKDDIDSKYFVALIKRIIKVKYK